MSDNPNTARRNQRGTNLTQADRERGGRESASLQRRDSRGQFAGSVNRSQNASNAGQREPQNERQFSGSGGNGNGARGNQHNGSGNETDNSGAGRSGADTGR